MTTALIDADIIAYRCSASTEEVDVAIWRANKMMQDTLAHTGCASYLGFLTGSTNFRKIIYPKYKANRVDVPRPITLEPVREYLSTEWHCYLTDGLEADDELGLNQTDDTILCTIDKDLKMIPGQHFDFVKNIHFEMTYLEAERHFWTQMLTGDSSDNIFGFDGKARAQTPAFIAKMLAFCETPQEMFEVVLAAYKEDYNRFLINGMCLHILRKERTLWLDDLRRWTLPDPLKHEVDQMYESMKYLMDGMLMGLTTTEPQTYGGPANGTPEVVTPTLIVPSILEIVHETT